jgi:hypothetical protein
MLTRTKPIPLLRCYLVGGFGLSFISGAVVVFVFKHIHLGKTSSVPPAIEIAIGTLALGVAILAGTGTWGRFREGVQVRQPDAHSPRPSTPSPSGGSSAGEPIPGFAKLPAPVRKALSKESPWVAWIAGLAVGTPSACYAAAIAAILKSDSSAGEQIAALIVFNVIGFAQAAIPMVSFLIKPEATRDYIQRLYTWITSHEQSLVTIIAAVVGVYLVVFGVSKL